MKKGTIAVILAGLLMIGVRAFDPPTNPLDEFLPLVAAQRILGGDVPYRDYTTLYPPLTSLVDAALLAVFPRSLLLARFVFVALSLAGLALVKHIATRLSGSERAGTVAGLLAALVHGAPHWGYSLELASVLILGAFACALPRAGGSGAGGPARPRFAALAGALLGLASLARHDAALYGSLPIALLVLSRSRRDLAWLLGVAAIFPLGLVLVLAALGALGPAFEQLVVIPSTLYSEIRGLPWPRPWVGPGDAEMAPSLGSIYGPFIVSGLALVRAWTTTRRRDHLAAALLPFALGANALVRPDHAHVYGASLASFAALGVLADAGWRWLAPVLALTLPLARLEVWESARLYRHVLSPKAVFATRVPRQGLLDKGGIDNRRARTLDWIAERANGSRIFVALPRHDRIWINDVSFYFDAGLLPATRHHELYALVATTDPVQEEIVGNLERWKPPYVVVATVAAALEPNASSRVFPVHVLDDYLARHYALDMEDGRYEVLRRLP